MTVPPLRALSSGGKNSSPRLTEPQVGDQGVSDASGESSTRKALVSWSSVSRSSRWRTIGCG